MLCSWELSEPTANSYMPTYLPSHLAMWTPVELPFKSNGSPALPTTDEIRSCPEVIQRRSAKKVVALNDKVIAKLGGAIDVAEGQALIFQERHAPSVPAPRLHAMFRDGDETFLIMERAPGTQLDAVWPSLTESDRVSEIFSDLKAQPYLRFYAAGRVPMA